MLNLIIWLIVLFITITWTVGVVFKPKKMGGEQSWGPVNFKIAILWWISIIFVFITKVSPFYFILMMPISIFIISYFSGKAEINFALKNKQPPESILTRSQPNTEALLPSLIVYCIILIILYFINNLS
mgnify:FL=1